MEDLCRETRVEANPAGQPPASAVFPDAPPVNLRVVPVIRQLHFATLGEVVRARPPPPTACPPRAGDRSHSRVDHRTHRPVT